MRSMDSGYPIGTESDTCVHLALFRLSGLSVHGIVVLILPTMTMFPTFYGWKTDPEKKNYRRGGL